MKTSRSLRLNLAATYAGMALLTAVLLGAILLGVLGNYYARSEDAYLRSAAARIAASPPVTSSDSTYRTWVALTALETQTRVKLFGADGELIADSGSPAAVDPARFLRDELRGQEFGDRERGDRPAPLGRGLFRGAQESPVRSSRALTLALTQGQGSGFVELSEAPASGRDALIGVAQAWMLAAALAVLAAAFAGYALSSRISRPIVQLTDASDQMAEGDLSARAPVTRHDEVGKLGESFNAMAERIETTVVALRRFVADAAHEIGTPLTALEADLELASEAATTDDERRLVERALGQARRLEDLSGNLLRLSRIEAGEMPGTEANVADVVAVTAEVVESVASRAEQAGLELRAELAPGPLPVELDRAELATVIGNLLENAIKFTPEGGSVSIAVSAAAERAVLIVADTGVGIPAAEQDEVFSRFHRARNVAAYPGSGLGLAIVHATIERAGGTVSFQSAEGEGTTFTAELPLV